MLPTVLTTAADQGLVDIPAGIAALGGTLIGGLAGVAGQVIAERARQKGQLRHQNRLLLQETHTRLVRLLHEARMMAMDIVDITARVHKEIPDEIEALEGYDLQDLQKEIAPRLGAMLTELGGATAEVQALGSFRIVYGLDQFQGWHGEVAKVLTTGPVTAEQLAKSAAATEHVIDWANWVISAIRAELGVKRPKHHERNRPEPKPFWTNTKLPPG